MHAMTLQGTSTTALHRGHTFLRCIVLLPSPCSLPTPLPCEGRHGFWPLSQGQGHHRTPSTFRQELSRIKDRDPALKTFRVVYEIPCSCGKKYRGETKRVLETQLKEHQAATRRGETKKSAIAEHAWSRHEHTPCTQECAIGMYKCVYTTDIYFRNGKGLHTHAFIIPYIHTPCTHTYSVHDLSIHIHTPCMHTVSARGMLHCPLSLSRGCP